MDQQPSIQLFDFSRSGQLCETLAGILMDSLKNETQLRWEVVGDFPGEFEEAFLKRLEISKPQLVLLILATAQVALVRKIIQGIKSNKNSPEIILVTQECDTNEILDLMTLGASDFITPPFNVAATIPRVRRLLHKAKWRNDSTQSLKA